MMRLQCLTDEVVSTCGFKLIILNGKQETIIPIKLIEHFDIQLPDALQNGVIRISTFKPKFGSVVYSIGGAGSKNEIILLFLEKDLATAKAIQRYAKTFAFRFAFYSGKAEKVRKDGIRASIANRKHPGNL